MAERIPPTPKIDRFFRKCLWRKATSPVGLLCVAVLRPSRTVPTPASPSALGAPPDPCLPESTMQAMGDVAVMNIVIQYPPIIQRLIKRGTPLQTPCLSSSSSPSMETLLLHAGTLVSNHTKGFFVYHAYHTSHRTSETIFFSLRVDGSAVDIIRTQIPLSCAVFHTCILRCLSCSAACFAHSCHLLLSATSSSFSSDRRSSPSSNGLFHIAPPCGT